MKRILVLGGGRIGGGVAELLKRCPEYGVTLADRDETALALWRAFGGDSLHLEQDAPGHLESSIAGHEMVINALPVGQAPEVALACLKAGAHYLDLSEDVEARRRIRDIAATAQSAFVPACGLAPGFAEILAYGLAQRFDRLDEMHIRIGAMPEKPEGVLKYALSWSTEGLINQYCNPGEAILRGRLCRTEPLGDLENFTLDGVVYEAFNTSGGLGTLHETLAGKVGQLDYKTIRHPGHCDMMRLLIQDLRLGQRRDLLKAVLENAMPGTCRDIVIILVYAQGKRGGHEHQEFYHRHLTVSARDGRAWSAIRQATAFSVAAVADLLAKGMMPVCGFVRQEDIDLDTFLANRFGQYFALEAERAVA